MGKQSCFPLGFSEWVAQELLFASSWRLLLLVFSLCVRSTPQELPSFRAEVNLEQGELLKNLTKKDFEILEDGVPQTIQFFARRAELPLSLGILVDVSESQARFLKQHGRDILLFLQRVLRPSDQAFVVCFGNHLRLVSDKISSVPALLEGLRRFAKGDRHFRELGPVEERELGTALYDAIYFSALEKLDSAEECRRALLVFGDGEENSSEHDLLDAIAAAQNTNTLLYGIRYTPERYGQLSARNRYGIRVMRHLASQTGAADFDGRATDLATVFTQIGEELHSLYEIGYVSSHAEREGVFRKITIRCKRAQTVVRSKSGYYAH